MRMLRTPFARLLPRNIAPRAGTVAFARWLAGSLSVSPGRDGGVGVDGQLLLSAGAAGRAGAQPGGRAPGRGLDAGRLALRGPGGARDALGPAGRGCGAPVRSGLPVADGGVRPIGMAAPAVPTPPAWTIAVTAAVLVAYMPRLGRAKMPDRLRIGRRIGALVCVAVVLAAWWGKT